MKKILIAGAPKSGTTALYFNIKNSLPRNAICLFEPKEFINDNYDINQLILVKILVTPNVNYKTFMSFENKIFIYRDPRDKMISELLYLIGFHFPEMNINDCNLNSFYNLLKKKENDPSKVSFKEMLYHIKSVPSHILSGFKRSLEFIDKYEDFFLLKYEDFCLGNINNLENYLQIKLSDNKEVGAKYSRVVRTKSFGNWKDWFIEKDIDYFKPLFEEYMNEFNYDSNNWTLNDKQSILSKYCSNYFIDILNQRRKMLKIEPISF